MDNNIECKPHDEVYSDNESTNEQTINSPPTKKQRITNKVTPNQKDSSKDSSNHFNQNEHTTTTTTTSTTTKSSKSTESNQLLSTDIASKTTTETTSTSSSNKNELFGFFKNKESTTVKNRDENEDEIVWFSSKVKSDEQKAKEWKLYDLYVEESNKIQGKLLDRNACIYYGTDSFCPSCGNIYDYCHEKRYGKYCMKAVWKYVGDMRDIIPNETVENIFTKAYNDVRRADVELRHGYFISDWMKLPNCVKNKSLKDALTIGNNNRMENFLTVTDSRGKRSYCDAKNQRRA